MYPCVTIMCIFVCTFKLNVTVYEMYEINIITNQTSLSTVNIMLTNI